MVSMYGRVEGSWCASSFGTKQVLLLELKDHEDEGTTILLSGSSITN
jgi:hypothetical protein